MPVDHSLEQLVTSKYLHRVIGEGNIDSIILEEKEERKGSRTELELISKDFIPTQGSDVGNETKTPWPSSVHSYRGTLLRPRKHEWPVPDRQQTEVK